MIFQAKLNASARLSLGPGRRPSTKLVSALQHQQASDSWSTLVIFQNSRIRSKQPWASKFWVIGNDERPKADDGKIQGWIPYYCTTGKAQARAGSLRTWKFLISFSLLLLEQAACTVLLRRSEKMVE